MRTPDEVTTFETQAGALRPPWPFTGRDEEVELVRRSSAVGRPGIVISGPAGCGRTRLAAEALRGADCARVAGTPGMRDLPFAAFAPLLPEGVSLHRAVQLLTGVGLLLVDDAHLLDDASAALLHQLAVQGRTRLLILVTDGAPVPDAVSRLWTGELLPRLVLAPLSREESAPLLTAGAGGPLEPLTANRLHRLCGGDLRLLRDLLDALGEQGRLTRYADSEELMWRGPVPVTPALRERSAAALGRACPDERETLDRLAFAEPLAPAADTLDLRVLERLEADGLLDVDDADATVRLAHPLHGPVLRAAAGRLRARRLTARRGSATRALDAEAAGLTRRIERADVRTTPTPVGEWLVAEGRPVPPRYAAVRARFSRLRGELREAAAWAREGLAADPQDHACRTELALAAAQSGETGAPIELLAEHPGTAAWPPAARGDLDTALETLQATTPGTAPGPTGVAVTPGAPAPRARPAPGHAGAAYDARGVQAASGPADRGSRALDGTGAADGAVGPCAHAGASGAHASQVRPAPGHAGAAYDARGVQAASGPADRGSRALDGT
ncbi:hypothetical protein, partial [Streptomyces sp. NPDC017435]|uniref:hypothetical protein n=1 Tax=Streptomyces sp. NPDC017435 TaxID=3364995 RepID=UPI0037A66EA7